MGLSRATCGTRQAAIPVNCLMRFPEKAYSPDSVFGIAFADQERHVVQPDLAAESCGVVERWIDGVSEVVFARECHDVRCVAHFIAVGTSPLCVVGTSWCGTDGLLDLVEGRLVGGQTDEVFVE